MTTVNQELILITQRQEDLKAQLQNVKDSGGTDVDLVKSLQTELDQTTARQLQLLTEQNDIIHRQRRAEKYVYFQNEKCRPWEIIVYFFYQDLFLLLSFMVKHKMTN